MIIDGKKLHLLLKLVWAFSLLVPLVVQSQHNTKDSLLNEVTLQNAIDYAVRKQPAVQRSLLDEEITRSQIRSRLADWYPQVNFNYSLQHNFIIQTSIIGGNPVKLGVSNISASQFTLSQAIFNRDVLLAKRTKGDVLLQAKQQTSNEKIDVAANVAKAFYDVLSSLQQIKVSSENIVRIQKSLTDAYNQYKAGITDKIDYKRATITLNNSKASLKNNEELLKAKLEYLKSLMGYPINGILNIVYDSLQMENQVSVDTLATPDYANRIEYRLLETQKKLLQYNLQYNKWSFLPTVSANGAYNFNFQNNNLAKLYGTNFPNSFAALTLGLPIFQGGKRRANIKTAQFQLQQNEIDIISFKNRLNAEYAQALSAYKSYLANYQALKENLLLAKEVYDVIQLQYRSGIKTYLEVITAETDLRTSQINYYNALYQLLAARVDVQKAAGEIKY
jgi:outer membrane protein